MPQVSVKKQIELSQAIRSQRHNDIRKSANSLNLDKDDRKKKFAGEYDRPWRAAMRDRSEGNPSTSPRNKSGKLNLDKAET